MHILKKNAPTLHPSQVMAPKCIPDAGALHTWHGKPLNSSAIVGLVEFSIFRNKMFNFSKQVLRLKFLK